MAISIYLDGGVVDVESTAKENLRLHKRSACDHDIIND